VSRRLFATLPDGRPVEEVVIAAGGLTAAVISWGATVRDLRLAGVGHPLTLGFETFDPYPRHGAHFGAIAGRCANRIGGARLALGGRTYALDRNDGANHLHGGLAGFGVRPWTVAAAGPDRVTLTLVSPDGDGGYPGRVAATCVYRVAPPATLVVELSAETDAPTIVNLAQHCYFALDGRGDARAHRLAVAADRFTPTGPDLIPTGAVAPVAGTPWDFRAARPIGLPGAPAYDGNLVLADARRAAPAFAARLTGADGVSLELWTTEPGLQLYDAGSLDCPFPGLGGRRYGPHAGVCLEAQLWPDALGRPGFPSPVLAPGARYAQVTEYRFRPPG
jgi:aldose 1-epimerase